MNLAGGSRDSETGSVPRKPRFASSIKDFVVAGGNATLGLFWRAESEPLEWPQPAAVLTTDRSVLGEHAKRLRDDPVLSLAFDKLREDLAAEWRNTKADDTQGRERAYFMVWGLEGVRAKLQALLDDAKVIEAEQKRKEAEADRR